MRKLAAYCSVLVWMTVIFVASTDVGSRQRTSRIIGPLLKWFKPDISEETIYHVQSLIRKSGHVSEYAVLAVLIWVARRTGSRRWDWSRREFWVVLACCAAYACTDEFHQMFVPSREGALRDVIIDTCGAAGGLLLIWSIGRWRRRW